MSLDDRTRVEEALRRIDGLVAALGHIADPAAREQARELVEAILDLHGLALARIVASLAAAAEGRVLIEHLAADEQVKAVLLLHGLHPDDPEARVRQALAAIAPRLAAAGVTVELDRVTAETASLRVLGAAEDAAALRREIEEAIGDAAPDLAEIAIEWPSADAAAALAAAG